MAYSRTEKLLHYIGFNSLIGQEIISSMSDTVYAKKLVSIPIRKPIFVTSLARSGTSLLLKLLLKSEQLASHTYRDMPFVLCPLFWRNLSSRFYVYSEEQERAHKDGLKISFDSEEAFEEILWKYFFKDHYSRNLIQPIEENFENEEFKKFFINHMKKIIFIHQLSSQKDEYRRYISKNNVNFTRISYISKILKDAIFVVPVRNPMTHIRSLMNQHENFLEIHSRDKFAKKYMDYLGHYEFGQLFKRMNVGNKFEEKNISWNLLDESFWVEYWCDIHQYLIDLSMKNKNIVFVNYERLCNEPEEMLQKLYAKLELRHDVIPKILPFIKRCAQPTHNYPPMYNRAFDIYSCWKNN